jgi:hypothetical protein
MSHGLATLLALALVVAPLIAAWLAIARIVRRQDAHIDNKCPASGGT